MRQSPDDEAADDLSRPLGVGPKPRKRFALASVLPQIFAGVLGLFVLAFVLWAAITRDPLGGEPIGRVALGTTPPAQSGSADPQAGDAGAAQARGDAAEGDAAAEAAASRPGTRTVTIIDGSSGKRQEVVVPGPAGAKRMSADPKLLETSRHGPIPKIAQDGTRPADSYARPFKAAQGAAGPEPRIAVILGGLGVSAATTADAIAKLPAEVTLAFTPYGEEVQDQAARARADEHEVLLQVPMEPIDFPDNDPGPQTLLTTLGGEQNVDRLHWLFSRFQGYVGITNFMGARFTASEQALAPVLREVARRGLIYVDDGSSPRSVADQIAGANNLPFAKADIVVDAVPSAAEIDKALARLETLARSRGFAVGYGSALPVTIERIALWAKAAQKRGIALAPVSAAAIKASTEARRS